MSVRAAPPEEGTSAHVQCPPGVSAAVPSTVRPTRRRGLNMRTLPKPYITCPDAIAVDDQTRTLQREFGEICRPVLVWECEKIQNEEADENVGERRLDDFDLFVERIWVL